MWIYLSELKDQNSISSPVVIAGFHRCVIIKSFLSAETNNISVGRMPCVDKQRKLLVESSNKLSKEMRGLTTRSLRVMKNPLHTQVTIGSTTARNTSLQHANVKETQEKLLRLPTPRLHPAAPSAASAWLVPPPASPPDTSNSFPWLSASAREPGWSQRREATDGLAFGAKA